MQEFDIAIFGAGIAGASLAYQVAGMRSVVLVEREAQAGMHSTGRSAAMFMESYGPPAARALTRASRAFYEHPPEGFASSPLLVPRGALYVAASGQAALLSKMRDELRATSTVIDELDSAQALDRVPCLRRERLLGALYEADARDLDVHALHQGFLSGARRAGGELRLGATLQAAKRRDDAWELEFAEGEPMRARTVVDAAGAWADELAQTFGAVPIGLTPRRRSAFTFQAPDTVDVTGWPCVAGIDEGWYFKPDAGRLLGSPANADPTTPHDVLPETLDIATGIDRIQAMTTLSIRRPASTWAGLRSFVADGELVIGFDARCAGFFWLAGQGGYGIQSAAGASMLAASLLVGAGLPEPLAACGVEPAAMSPARLR